MHTFSKAFSDEAIYNHAGSGEGGIFGFNTLFMWVQIKLDKGLKSNDDALS